MKTFILNTVVIFHTVFANCQKPLIDTGVFDKWPATSTALLSSNRNFASYEVQNQPINSRTLIFQACRSAWRRQIIGAFDAQFTQEGDFGVFKCANDSIGIINLLKDSIEFIPRATSFKLLRYKGEEWLSYVLNDPEKSLVFRNLNSYQFLIYKGISDYFVESTSFTIVLQTNEINDKIAFKSLSWFRLGMTTPKIFWKGQDFMGPVFDRTRSQVAFAVQEDTSLSFWNYKFGDDTVVLIARDTAFSLNEHVYLHSIENFSDDGRKLFVRLQERNRLKEIPGVVKVDVWSYKDSKLQSEQLTDLLSNNFVQGVSGLYEAVLSLDTKRLLRLQYNNDYVIGRTDHILLIRHLNGDPGGGEWKWNKAWNESFFIVGVEGGHRKALNVTFPKLSPNGEYVIFYKSISKNFYSYSVSTGRIRNITAGIRTQWTPDGLFASKYSPIGIAAWSHDERFLLLYDKFDIWKIDPIALLSPKNITNKYGSRKQIVYRLDDNMVLSDRLISKDILLLRAFNERNKESGFFEIKINGQGDPTLLTMGPFVYRHLPAIYPFTATKDGDSDYSLIERMSATQSPNYFITSDFRKFSPLSNVYPEKMYNWLTSELVTWRTFNGRYSQGILYKPENFDSKKKYPVIFEYYERLSDELNLYRPPELSFDRINIPWFVSHGYLVFMPDIHYKIGFTGKSVVNSILSAAQYLAGKPWVNGAKIGIQGHSFGGYETNYLITHTRAFAASCSASSISDCISDYGSISGSGATRSAGYEVGHEGMGSNPWMHKTRYIENSPIFYVDRVTTPVLLMSNKNDDVIPFSQGLEFFISLRRLGKPAWLLQYDGEGHSVTGKAAADYSIRMAQFFNHFLKDEPAPTWMTIGIPARLKGIDLGYGFGFPEGGCQK